MLGRKCVFDVTDFVQLGQRLAAAVGVCTVLYVRAC